MTSIARRVWKLLPKPLQDWCASLADRLGGISYSLPELEHPGRQYRLFIGPVNHTGQGFRWARAVERVADAEALSFVREGSNLLRYPFDYTVRWRTAEHSRAWQRGLLEELEASFTHVLVEATAPLLGGMYRADVSKQVRALQQRGLRVALIWHGVDVRLPSRHLGLEPNSYFRDMSEEYRERAEKTAHANLALGRDLGLTLFVSTAGLLIDIPEAKLLGITIDVAKWQTDAPLLRGLKPVVLHAPSNPQVKGTAAIRPIARELNAEGIIDYRELQLVSNEEMPAAVSGADVVLDQFGIGDYGAAACEAMAAGRLVVSHVSEQVRSEMFRQAGMELPIVEATPETIESVLRHIGQDPAYFREIAQRGPEYVRRMHDGTFSGEVLSRYFLKLP